MPIYTYNCEECGITADYLVGKVGATPDACRGCGSAAEQLTRILHGQTFGIVGSARIDSKGIVHDTTSQSLDSVASEATPILEPGIHITVGKTANGKEAINVSRVQANGQVDASVTGYRTIT